MSLDTRSFIAEMRSWADQVRVRAVEEMAADLDRDVPVAPEGGGALRRSQEIRHLGVDRSEIVYPPEYASYTDEGTDAHEIRGRPLLAFPWDGTLVVVHSVQHPGTQGTHWWSDVMNDDGYDNALNAAAEQVKL